MSEFKKPDKCAGCPVICEINSRLAALAAHKSNIESFTTGDDLPEELVGMVGEIYDMPPDIAQSVVDQDVLPDVLRHAAGHLNHLDAEIEYTRATLDVLTQSCGGSVVLEERRIFRKSGIMAVVCGSLDVEDATQNGLHEPVHVVRPKREG